MLVLASAAHTFKRMKIALYQCIDKAQITTTTTKTTMTTMSMRIMAVVVAAAAAMTTKKQQCVLSPSPLYYFLFGCGCLTHLIAATMKKTHSAYIIHSTRWCFCLAVGCALVCFALLCLFFCRCSYVRIIIRSFVRSSICHTQLYAAYSYIHIHNSKHIVGLIRSLVKPSD